MKKILKLNEYIDHTNLKATTTNDDIRKLCQEAMDYNFKSVCVNPSKIGLCVELLKNSPVLICTVVGFPLGQNTTIAKIAETIDAVDRGADEIDMVINISELKNRNKLYCIKEINEVVRAARGKTVKVIVETDYLTLDDKIFAFHVVNESDAQFIKTSTGFASKGAQIEDIQLWNELRKEYNSNLLIKAAGGISTYEELIDFIMAGADRIGSSRSVQILKDHDVVACLTITTTTRYSIDGLEIFRTQTTSKPIAKKIDAVVHGIEDTKEQTSKDSITKDLSSKETTKTEVVKTSQDTDVKKEESKKEEPSKDTNSTSSTSSNSTSLKVVKAICVPKPKELIEKEKSTVKNKNTKNTKDKKVTKKETQQEVSSQNKENKEKKELDKSAKIAKTQKHTQVKELDFNNEENYSLDLRKKQWKKWAGYNPKQVVCDICKDDDNYATMLLDNNKHVCYFCWIKKPSTLKKELEEKNNSESKTKKEANKDSKKTSAKKGKSK